MIECPSIGAIRRSVIPLNLFPIEITYSSVEFVPDFVHASIVGPVGAGLAMAASVPNVEAIVHLECESGAENDRKHGKVPSEQNAGYVG